MPRSAMTILAAPWTLAPRQILEHFAVDPDAGLAHDQAANHALLYGRNGACVPPDARPR